jgi:myosin heavy subunit
MLGLLDIFGFENVSNNSLEQLCINFANEKLQYFFVLHTLEKEQKVYEAENLPWAWLKFTNNKACLDVLSGRCMLFDILDEECRLNRDVGVKKVMFLDNLQPSGACKYSHHVLAVCFTATFFQAR